MKFSSSRIPAAEHHLPLLLLLLSPVTALLDCKNIVADETKFNLGELKGAHTVQTFDSTPPTMQNTTYTVSICGPVKRKDKVDSDKKCPHGAWICGLQHTTFSEKEDDKPHLTEVIPIIGNMPDSGRGMFDVTPTRLSGSDSHSDTEKQGLRLVMSSKTNKYAGRKQKAIIEFICDKDFTGKEGEMEPFPGEEYEEQAESESDGEKEARRKREEGEDDKADQRGEQQIKKDGAALIFNSRRLEDDEEVLRLTWKTKFACEGTPDAETPSSSHWGFFTWFVVLVFFGTAAYLIFGSWINYSRYGARGWDLLPHGDMIRDIPYLLKDWIRRLINTLQGSGSRGGYSAV